MHVVVAGGGEQPRVHGRHMWSVLEPATSSSSLLARPPPAAAACSSYCFSKDGRKISIGDCALFKPPQDSPPFIGIVRRLILGEEENFRLSVNWLYRPADIKLGKGASLEAALNEVFYSFHKDDIPAASLLHPCKVAFLPRGVELPSGISSFVCRRVYDIENKCLWWLTDQDYINERQEEVDHLLQKTRLEMYGGVQSGGRSPKGLNGTAGSQQLRSGSENAQNIHSHLPSQFKIKKRERVDQGLDPVKKERVSRAVDTDVGHFRADNVLKSEIAKITDRGGLTDIEGVEKLVQLMHPGSTEKKIDLACRMMLVDVLSATDKFDCLGWFVQLRGLPVLDEWLQEIHPGKVGDGTSPKESDKYVDEFLLILLRALEKLPVNLHALQTCNVGKSVNCLRTHRNPEIQKKARSLVDTWKKRVEAEMNILDSKSGSSRGSSWPTKSVLPEVSPVANRRNGGQSEVSGKSSSPHSSCEVPSAKFGSGESVAKVVTPSPISSKSIVSLSMSGTTSTKDPMSVAVIGSDTLSTIKEEKSSSSGHSQNNSHSCSSDLAKTVSGSCREDARTSTAGSISGTKISVNAPRHRKSSYNLQGSVLSGSQKETNIGKFNPSKNMGVSFPGGTLERTCDVPVQDHGNSQRLIVRLPNTGRSPARSSIGSPCEDPAVLCKRSPPARSAKLDHHDKKIKEQSDALPSTTVPKGDMEDKNVLVRSDEGTLSFSGDSSNGKKKSADGSEKVMEALKDTNVSADIKHREGNLYDAFSSMNALIESCAKFSEASNNTVSGGDDVGMNLLASVAAEEMCRSDVSISVSNGKNLPLPEESCSGNDANSRHLDEDTARSENLASDVGIIGATLVHGDQIDFRIKNESPHYAVCTSFEDAMAKGNVNSGGAGEFHDQRKSGVVPSKTDEEMNATRVCDKNMEENKSVIPEVAGGTEHIVKEVKGESPSFSSTEMCREEKGSVLCKDTDGATLNEQKPPVMENAHQESVVGRIEENEPPSSSVKETKEEKAFDMNVISQMQQSENHNNNVLSTVCAQNKDHLEKSDKKVLGNVPDISSEEPSTVLVHQTNESVQLNQAGGSHVVVKLDFDLNEGFPVDDGYLGEFAKSPVCGDVSNLQLHCPLPLPISSMSGSFPASITVASAAKGPFFPPENSFRGKGEFGWKGSAATSAFRPAEPRKPLDNTTGSSPVNSMVGNQGRSPLDIDLNVADERILEDVASQCLFESRWDHHGSGLDLDLNRADETHEVRKLSVNNNCKMGVPREFSKPARFHNAELNASRDIDLNSGPDPDEVASEAALRVKSNVPSFPPLTSVRMSAADQGSLSSWFSQSNSYQPIAITPVLPNRGEHCYPIVTASGSQRIMGHPAGITSFGPEFHRGQVLSSSPALPFPSAVPFQYPFPFETNFPMPSHSYSNTSTTYPSIPSQLVGPSGVVTSSHYPRPYIMNGPGGASNTGSDSRKRASQALDLNAGPGVAEIEHRDERSSSALRRSWFSSSVYRGAPDNVLNSRWIAEEKRI